MKNLKSIALALLAFVTLSTTAQTKKVDAAKSTINWVGKKVTGAHEGTINLKEGALIFKGKKLVGGNFTVKCNIFSELKQNASLLFFRKKINENCNRKILRDNGKLKPNFVLKILFGKILCEIKN